MTEGLEQEVINENAPERTASTQMQEAMWGDEKPIVNNNAPEEKPVAQAQSQPVVVEEIVVPTDWLKREFDIEDPAILKAEREELKAIKANPPKAEEIKFADEQSKQIYELLREGGEKRKEVLQILKNQEEIENLSGLEVNVDNAADIIKLQMKLKNKQLTAKEIEFQYNQNYVAPKEPVQRASELDEDFEERHNEWKEKVETVQMKRVIDAKMAQPDLSKLKSELVFPDIKREGSQQQQLSQEDLKAMKENADEFSKFADTVINSFNGFTVQVKDKDVDYPVSYGSSQEEKTFIATELKNFAESNFDANALLAKRWVENDGKTIKVEQMVKDLSRIYYGEKAEQKIATDAANKRMDEFLKSKKQINVNETTKTSTFVPNEKTKSEQMQEQFWSN